MNTQLVDSLVQVIRALSPEECTALTEKLFFDHTYPTTEEITALALKGNSFDFLDQEPDLYNCEDGKSLSSL
jgi:hypothetical protein